MEADPRLPIQSKIITSTDERVHWLLLKILLLERAMRSDNSRIACFRTVHRFEKRSGISEQGRTRSTTTFNLHRILTRTTGPRFISSSSSDVLQTSPLCLREAEDPSRAEPLANRCLEASAPHAASACKEQLLRSCLLVSSSESPLETKSLL